MTDASMNPASAHSTSSATPAMTIGIDLGDLHCHLCAMDEHGTIVEQGRLLTTQDAFLRRFTGMARARIAIEVGTHSPWIAPLLQRLGHDVFVANPRKVRAIYENEGKRDEIDAEQLCRIARLDPKLLSPIEHRPQETRADLAVVRARATLVEARTKAINHVRGCVKSFGARLPRCSTLTFARRVAWKIPRELRGALVPVLRTIADVTKRIVAYEKRIEQIAAERYPETARLRQVDGVGPVTALAFVLTIEDAKKFRKSRSVGAYLGLRPGRNQSGRSDPEMHITKAGDTDLRRLLVQSAQYTLGPFGKDSDLRRFGLAMASRGRKSAKKRALIAVARKLAVLLHKLWASNADYDPLRHAEGKNPSRRSRAVKPARQNGAPVEAARVSTCWPETEELETARIPAAGVQLTSSRKDA